MKGGCGLVFAFRAQSCLPCNATMCWLSSLKKVDHLRSLCASCLMSTRLMTRLKLRSGLKIAAIEVLPSAVFLGEKLANPYPGKSGLDANAKEADICSFLPGTLETRASCFRQCLRGKTYPRLSGPQSHLWGLWRSGSCEIAHMMPSYRAVSYLRFHDASA